VYEAPSWRLGPQFLPPTLYKHKFLWSDHGTKGVQTVGMLKDMKNRERCGVSLGN